jgi:hypothetical protein
MNSSLPFEYNETIRILQESIERLETENATLRAQLEAGFQEAVRQFSASLHVDLDSSYDTAQFVNTQPLGLGPN